ncbi:hypothetical protein [Dechloromonas sp.]|nr:hypothetical protein [Dechloromonas sp.]
MTSANIVPAIKNGGFMTLGRLDGAVYDAAHRDEAYPFPTASKMAMDIQ